MQRFNNIVSLGYNCEVSFRIQDHYGYVNSIIYSWAYIEDRDRFLRSLDEMELLVKSDKQLLPHGMFRSEKYGISFHSKIPKELLIMPDGTVDLDNIGRAKEEMEQRYSYLARKLQRMFQSQTEKTLYVCKMYGWEKDVNRNRTFINNLYNTLQKLCCRDNFALLIVMEKNDQNFQLQSLEEKGIFTRFVEKFADDSETRSGGDQKGWNAIFDEFELIEESKKASDMTKGER